MYARRSFQLAINATPVPRRIGGAVLFIEHGPAQWRAKLDCRAPPATDPSYASLEISFDAQTREFGRRLVDACGEERAVTEPLAAAVTR